ncbi:hypothetical protein [Alkalihalobacillus sp. R86527]|uniref:hypothetical protein n=1 Tax=Alkalihalobacillus sp. R86527 TaxID=3093863 RepID=UPI003672CA09
MFVGRLLYIIGIGVVVGSGGVFLLGFFSGSGASVTSSFGILNGLIAMGVGDLVIQSNHKSNLESRVEQRSS